MKKEIKIENIFDAIPDNINEELVDLLVQNKNVRIERIISKGHTSPAAGWYNQSDDEWVVVLKGAAIIAFEDSSDISLKTGDYLHIAAHKKHRVKWTDMDVETVWLAVHY